METEMDLSNPDKTPFGQLPRAVQEAMVIAVDLDKKIVDMWDGFRWGSGVGRDLHSWRAYAFRIRPVPPVPDMIPWEVIHPDIKWVARTESGLFIGATSRLGLPCSTWMIDYGAGSIYPLSTIIWHTLFKIGTCDWKDSLQQRPEGK